MAMTKTGKDGKFVVADLKPGKYLLEVDVKKAESIINTTRSNIKHQSIVLNEVQEDQVSIEFSTGKEAKPFAPVAIEISAKQGKITGVIPREVPEKPSGAK